MMVALLSFIVVWAVVGAFTCYCGEQLPPELRDRTPRRIRFIAYVAWPLFVGAVLLLRPRRLPDEF